MYNFDQIIDRFGTNALNTDGFRGYIFKAGPEKVFSYKDDEFIDYAQGNLRLQSREELRKTEI